MGVMHSSLVRYASRRSGALRGALRRLLPGKIRWPIPPLGERVPVPVPHSPDGRR
jgi:hypothetical protein